MKIFGAPTNDFQNNIFEHQLIPDQFCGSDFLCEENNSKEVCVATTNGKSHSPSPSPVVESSDVGESSKGEDTATIFKYITEMLMEEEDLGSKPFMLHDSLALLATEKSLYDVLNNDLDQSCSINMTRSLYDDVSLYDVLNNDLDQSCSINTTRSLYDDVSLYDVLNNDLDKSCSIAGTSSGLTGGFEYIYHDSEPRNYSYMASDHSPNISGVKKYRSREDDSALTEFHTRNKQLANNIDESEALEIYDDVLICSNLDCQMQACCERAGCKAKQKSSKENEQSKGGKKKEITLKESGVDLRNLLMQCLEAMSNTNRMALNDLLWEIRLHSSPNGDGMERVAHYFANAIEARIAGTGTALFAALESKIVSTTEVLKAYKMFVTKCPFKHMSNIFSNKTIGNLASRATTLHIIDFGIMYGCQWACLIHSLSQRPGGPPKLRITGIDFPQPGFRPAERVMDTGRRLAKYGERYGVPFEYNAIAKKWDTISFEDLKIEENELLVVNSMFRLHNVQDAMETGYSPRDAVLNLIQKINPDMFIHGVANGTYNSPFFAGRFKEALFHFSTMFDMYDAMVPRDDEDRLLFEQQFFGKEVMNIISCEGTERVERPETYKQWQWRTERAGFRQVPIDKGIVKHVKKVKKDYHKSFSVDEDGKWVLLGWKGRIILGFSCWKPTHK